MSSTAAVEAASEPEPNEEEQRTRVIQIHTAYLNTLYAVDYYNYMHASVMRYARHLDFAIALCAAFGGSSGIGATVNEILNKEEIYSTPALVIFAAIVTVASVTLSVAKSVYGWSERSAFALGKIERYTKLALEYELLVEEMNFKKRWNSAYNETYIKLREREESDPTDRYPKLPESVQRKLQAEIKARIPFRDWWRPGESGNLVDWTPS